MLNTGRRHQETAAFSIDSRGSVRYPRKRVALPVFSVIPSHSGTRGLKPMAKPLEKGELLLPHQNQ